MANFGIKPYDCVYWNGVLGTCDIGLSECLADGCKYFEKVMNDGEHD